MRIVVAALTLLVAATAAAQGRGAAVSGSVAAVNMDSRTELAFSGAFAFRLNRVVELEIETTWVPRVRSDFPTGPVVIQESGGLTTVTSGSVSTSSVQIFPTPFYANPGGRIAVFTNAARIDIPTTTSRLTPYFAAGGGVANVRRTADYIIPVPLQLPAPGTPTPINTPVRQIAQSLVSSVTSLALTIGGGVDVNLTSSLAVEGDLRLFRLLGQDDQNVGRFSVGARYRF
jgi:opacity protein-like surface antigen